MYPGTFFFIFQGANNGGEVTSIIWEQVSPETPKVELTGANTLNPTFKAPAEGREFLFKLTLTGPTGTSTKIGKRWTINGTSDIFGPGVKVSIYVGDAVPANLLTSVNVNNRGAFTYTTINSAKSIVQGGTLTLVSTSGGKLTNVAVTVR